MTTPHDDPGFLLRMILDRLDEIGKKLDGPTGLVSHEIRLTAVERKLEGSWKTKVTIGAALLSGVLGILSPVFIK